MAEAHYGHNGNRSCKYVILNLSCSNEKTITLIHDDTNLIIVITRKVIGCFCMDYGNFILTIAQLYSTGAIKYLLTYTSCSLSVLATDSDMRGYYQIIFLLLRDHYLQKMMELVHNQFAAKKQGIL